MDESDRKKLAETLATTKSEPIIREIVRLGETFLAEQLKAGLAADMRAVTLAAVLAAVFAGLLGGTATVLAAKIDIGPHIFAVIAFGAPLLVAIVMAVNAAKPTAFDYSGNSPKRWAPVVGDGENIVRALAVQASYYAKGIEANGAILREHHQCIRRALGWVLTAIFAGVGTELVVVLYLIGSGALKLG